MKAAIGFIIELSVVIVNAIVARVFKYLVEYQKLHTVIEETISSFYMIFIMEFAILGLILMFQSFDPIGLSNLIRGVTDENDYRA
jgi:hypothetical protein